MYKKYPEDYNPILEYWAEIQSGKEVVSRKVYKTYEHLAKRINSPSGEFFYSPFRANHVLEFAENFCRHSKGRLGGQLVVLELWEKAMLAAMFGFIDIEGVRQYREALLIVGKKNGKSLLSSIVGLYLMIADNEPGAEIYAVAPLALDTFVQTVDGMKPMKDIVVGDYVFAPTGKPIHVKYLSPVVQRDTYEITFDDESKITATGNHLWTVERLGSNGKGKSSG